MSIRASSTVLAAFVAAIISGSASAEGLARITEDGVLSIGVRADAEPLSYMKDGVPHGYSVDVCKRVAALVAKQIGAPAPTLDFVEVTPENRFDMVAGGSVDMLCGATSVTLERRAAVDFSIPIYIDGASVMMRRGEGSGLAGLVGKRIGVRGGTTTEQGLRDTLRSQGIEAEVATVADHRAGRAALLAGEIDAYFADQSILVFLAGEAEQRDAFALAENVLSVEPQAIAIERGDSAFRLEIDRALSRMYRTGEIAEIFASAFAPAEMGRAMKALVLTAPIPE